MDTRTHYQFELDECSGWAKWLGTVAIPIVLVGLMATSPAWAGYLEAEVDACLEAEMTLGIHGAAEACWQARQEQARESLEAWQAIRPDVVAECADGDPMRVMACVWEAGR